MTCRFTSNRDELSVDQVHRFLNTSYWAKGVPLETVSIAMQHSLCFGLLDGEELVAFGRFVTDQASFAYLADVFVVANRRGEGLANRMLTEAFELPQLQQLRRIMLVTSDAHGLYQKFGFVPVDEPSQIMQRLDYSLYER